MANPAVVANVPIHGQWAMLQQELIGPYLGISHLIRCIKITPYPSDHDKQRIASLIRQINQNDYKQIDQCRYIFAYCRGHRIPISTTKVNMILGCPGAYTMCCYATPEIKQELDQMQLVLSQGGAPNGTNNGATLLNLAALFNYADVITYLITSNRYLRFSYNISLPGGESNHGYPSLTISCQNRDLAGVNAFLHGLDLNNGPDSQVFQTKWNDPQPLQEVSLKYHPLITACASGNAQIIKLLLSSGFTLFQDNHLAKPIAAICAVVSSQSFAAVDVLFDFIRATSEVGQQGLVDLVRQSGILIGCDDLLIDMLLIENGLDRPNDLRAGFLNSTKGKNSILSMQLMIDKGLVLDNDLVIKAIEGGGCQHGKKSISFLIGLLHNSTLEERSRIFGHLLKSRERLALSIISDLKNQGPCVNFELFKKNYLKAGKEVFGIALDFMQFCGPQAYPVNYPFIDKLMSTIDVNRDQNALVELLYVDWIVYNQAQDNIDQLVQRMRCFEVMLRIPQPTKILRQFIKECKQKLYKDKTILQFVVLSNIKNPALKEISRVLVTTGSVLDREYIELLTAIAAN